MEDNLIETNEATNPQSEEKTVGKFFPKRKFLNFIQGRKGGVRFMAKTVTSTNFPSIQ